MTGIDAGTLAPRPCMACDGSGTHPVSPPGVRWLCRPCHGSGRRAPFLHYDGGRFAAESSFDALGDGCTSDHRRVERPCARCGKAEHSARHECRLVAADKLCDEHHEFEPGLDVISTREGCPEHAIDRDRVWAWWAFASERGLELAPCGCCLAPAPVGSALCRFCAPAAEQAVAA